MSTELMTLSDVRELAIDVASSKLFPVKTKEEAFTLMMICQSEGLHPMQALKRYHIISGRPSMRADAMQAEFQRQGGRVRWISRSDTSVSAEFSHEVGGTITVEWTFEMAKKANLLGNQTWQKFPRQMLTARVISEGVRTVLPGVVSGLYTPEEVQDFTSPQTEPTNQHPTNEPPPPPAQTPASKTTSRYRPAASVPPVAPPPAKTPANVTEADFAPAPTAPAPEAPVATEGQAELPLDPTPSAPPVASAKPVEPTTKTVDVAALIAMLPDTASPVFLEQRKLASVLYTILEQTDPEAKAAYQCDLRGAVSDPARAAILNKMLKEVKA
jgi:hypothetical protein